MELAVRHSHLRTDVEALLRSVRMGDVGTESEEARLTRHRREFNLADFPKRPLDIHLVEGALAITGQLRDQCIRGGHVPYDPLDFHSGGFRVGGKVKAQIGGRERKGECKQYEGELSKCHGNSM